MPVTGNKGYSTCDKDVENEHDTLKGFMDIPGSGCLFNNCSAQDSGFINSTKLNDEIDIATCNTPKLTHLHKHRQYIYV